VALKNVADADLLPRVAQRCRDLGLRFSDVLRRAGVSRNFLYARPQHGRRLDRLEALARQLDWTLPELLGGSAPQTATFDRALHRHAYRMAADLLRYRDDTAERAALTATVADAIYPWLVDRRSKGLSIAPGEDDPAWAALHAVLLAVLDELQPNGAPASRRRGG